jgi:type 1 fimbria pilin
MKKHLLALSLGLSVALAGTSAFANTGTLNFEGKITSSTCPIEVVNPEDGQVGNQVKMGSIEASRFTASGQEFSGKRFGLRVKGGAGYVKPSTQASLSFLLSGSHLEESGTGNQFLFLQNVMSGKSACH